MTWNKSFLGSEQLLPPLQRVTAWVGREHVPAPASVALAAAASSPQKSPIFYTVLQGQKSHTWPGVGRLLCV